MLARRHTTDAAGPSIFLSQTLGLPSLVLASVSVFVWRYWLCQLYGFRPPSNRVLLYLGGAALMLARFVGLPLCRAIGKSQIWCSIFAGNKDCSP